MKIVIDFGESSTGFSINLLGEDGTRETICRGKLGDADFLLSTRRDELQEIMQRIVNTYNDYGK